MKKPLSWLISMLAIVAVAALVFTPMGCPQVAGVVAELPDVQGTIAFVSDRDGDAEIYLMNANGTSQTRFTWKPGRDDGPSLLKLEDLSYQVAFSSMASHYSGAAKAYRPTIDVFKMDADGSNKTNVSNAYGPDRAPSWSADGSKIVYSHVRKLNSAIFVINADGTSKVQLTAYPTYIGNYSDPTMSPDGTKIAYVNTVYIDPDTGDEVAHDAEIYVMEDDGSGFANKYSATTYTQTNLTDNEAEDLSPAWSPDGTKILFASNRDGDMEIYVMDADGTNVTNLTNNEVSDTAPCWSPDGNYIAFVSSRDGNAEIYVMNADGRDQARVTYNDASDGAPSWGP